MTASAPSAASETPANAIPVIDLGPYLAGEAGSLARTAVALKYALTDVGFYFVVNHGVPQALIDAAFAAAAAFHAQPLEAKMRLKFNEFAVGYLPMRGDTLRTSEINQNTKGNLNEALFIKRDLPPDHPDVLAGKPFRPANQWPDPADLPDFRSTVVAYCDALERLATSLLPLYATVLGMPPAFFDKPFRDPQFNLRMTHYPRQDVVEEGEFGIAPHVDSSFMTLLAQNEIPGLSIRTRDGDWIDAPSIPGSFIVNGGEMLRRWSNDRLLATPHRVINRSGRERYAIPFFFDCNIDWPITAVPTTVDADHPPKFEPTTYLQYMTWYKNRNYDVLKPAGPTPAAEA